MTSNPTEQHLLDGQMDLPFGPDEDAEQKKRLKETVEELSFYIDIESKAQVSYQVVGLDTSRQPVRAVLATASHDHCNGDDRIVCPYETAEFETLEEFVSSWATWKHSLVAVPSGDADPLGIRHWLECSGSRLERYDWWNFRTHLRGDLTLQNMGIDSKFQRAYSLALYRGYRLHASVVCRSIWGRLLEARYLLDDVLRDAHRLSAALDTLRPAGMDEIPF